MRERGKRCGEEVGKSDETRGAVVAAAMALTLLFFFSRCLSMLLRGNNKSSKVCKILR